jgi:hypothetical protein
MVFIDLKKAYVKIPRTVMWWTLEKHKVPTKYITLITHMYINVVTCVCTGDSETYTFSIMTGLYQCRRFTKLCHVVDIGETQSSIQVFLSAD